MERILGDSVAGGVHLTAKFRRRSLKQQILAKHDSEVMSPPKRQHPRLQLKRLALVLASILPLALLAWVLRPRNAEPEYQGRTLGRWLQDIEVYSSHPDRESAEFLAASNAVVQIGPEGLPCLVEWIQYEPSAADRLFWEIVGAGFHWLPNWMVLELFPEQMRRRSSFQRARAAGYALEWHGRNLEPVIPQLAVIAGNPWNRYGSVRALGALKAAGPRAWNEIANLVSATNSEVSVWALHRLGGMGTNALPAIPGLIHHLHGSNEYSARSAARILGSLQLKPELVVRALTRALDSPVQERRVAAAEALAQFREHASPALPKLEALLSNRNRYVRNAASNSVQVITASIQAKAAASSSGPTEQPARSVQPPP